MRRAFPAILAAMAAVILLLGYPRASVSPSSDDSPRFIITNIEIKSVYTRSVVFVLYVNAFNPYDVPVDLDLSVEIHAPNSPGDQELLSFGILSAANFAPLSWDREFIRTKEGLIRLYPLRYHALQFWGVRDAQIPEHLRPEGKSYVFPYLYDFGASLGEPGPVGLVDVSIVGQAKFYREGLEFTIPIKERIDVAFPFSRY